MASRRPPRDYVTGRVTSTLRFASCVVALVVASGLVVAYSGMPEVVPVHFSVTGEADGWGSRSSLLWLAGGGVVLIGLIAWLSCKPNIFNYPMPITEHNAQAIYREGERMMVWLVAMVVAVFAGIAMLSAGVPGGLMLTASLVGMPVVLIVGVVRMLRAEVSTSSSRQ